MILDVSITQQDGDSLRFQGTPDEAQKAMAHLFPPPIPANNVFAQPFTVLVTRLMRATPGRFTPRLMLDFVGNLWPPRSYPASNLLSTDLVFFNDGVLDLSSLEVIHRS
jgi:hypothetical protein